MTSSYSRFEHMGSLLPHHRRPADSHGTIHWIDSRPYLSVYWCNALFYFTNRALVFSLIGAWIKGWVNNREAGGKRCHHAHSNVTVMYPAKAVAAVVMATHGSGHQGPIPEIIRPYLMIMISRSHYTNADHHRLIRSRKCETKPFIGN